MQHLRTLLFLLTAALAVHCNPPKSTPPTAGKPITPRPDKPAPKPPGAVDTIVWKPGRRPSTPEQPAETQGPYRLALLLPFLTNPFSEGAVPDKSALALQFYGGARLAAEQLSRQGGPDLRIDVVDSQLSDAEFQSAMLNPVLPEAQVIIGPVRSSHVGLLAPQAKSRRQILLSPESPSSDVVKGYPDFLQLSPSLRAHCEAITEFVLRRHRPEAVTLLCKQKEADRLVYFQEALRQRNQAPFRELIVPDNTVNFNSINLASSLQPGKTSVFIVPSWASQDFVNAFLRKLKAENADVEVYGMPQWTDFENIEPEFLRANNVHIAKADFVDHNRPEVIAFQKAFYDAYGTIPDGYAFNGYDVTLFSGQMLKQYGLSFPDRLDQTVFKGLRTEFRIKPAGTPAVSDAKTRQFDYQENRFVYILKFDRFGYTPAY